MSGDDTTSDYVIGEINCSGDSGISLVLYRGDTYNQIMSKAIAFDTHRFVKHLTESGFTEKQAETLAEE